MNFLTSHGKIVWYNYRQFERVADSSGWNDQETITALILALTGGALQIRSNILENQQKGLYHSGNDSGLQI